MGEKLTEKKGQKTEKNREEKIGFEKDEKELKKAKKKDKVVSGDGKSEEVVEALETTGVEGEEITNVQINGRKDLVDDLEGRKKNKKKHREKKKDGVDGISSEVENFEAEKRGELVEGRKNRVDDPGENGEEEHVKKDKKKKKGKEKEKEKEKEGGDNKVKNATTNEEKLSKERNHLDGKVKEDGKLSVKEKNLDKVCDKVHEGTEIGDVVQMDNEKDGGKSKKKKKKREREDASDEVEDEMKADEEGDKSDTKKKRKRENNNEMKTDEGGDKSKKTERKRESASDEVEVGMKTNGEGEKSKKRKEKKERKSENGFDEVEDTVKTNEEGDKSKKKKRKMANASDEVQDKMKTGEEGEKSKKKKKKERKMENASNEEEDKMKTNEEGEKRNKKKKKEEEERKKEYVSDDVEDEMKTDKDGGKSEKNREIKREKVSGDAEDKSGELGKGDSSKDKKKKRKAEKQVSSGEGPKGKARTEKDIEVANAFETPTPQGKPKRVSFSDRVEVFSDDSPSGRESVSNEEEGLIQGKRFTLEEDELLRQAVLGYIEDHNLGDDGLHMVLNCKSYPEIKGCWKEISAALPWRPPASVYYRGHILFERDEKRKWTAEEYDYIREFYKKHGADWKKLSIELNKHRFHCKDTWRRIKLTGLKKGHWSQEEYQTLFDLVNMDLRMRALEERKSKHGMLRDNICWESISDRLSTRTNSTCCTKWYGQLTSPMVDQGLWADTDDYRLLDALSSLDASCMEDVDWDNLLEHREGHICRKRWNQMVKHIGECGLKSFVEQVEVLAKRYSPDCIEAREEFDSKPILP